MEILEIIILSSVLCNFLLSLFVFLSDPLKRLNKLFGVFGFITAIWVFTNFIFYYRGTPNLLLLKSGYAFGVLVPVGALLWVLELCEKKISKFKVSLILSSGLLFFLISFTNFVIIDVEKVYLGGFEGKTGPLFLFIYL